MATSVASATEIGGGSAAHNLLSSTHSDTTAASPVRGDLVTAQGASPAWNRLAKGTQYQVLTGGSTEPTWGAVALNQATAVSGVLPTANGGTGIAYFTAAGPTVARNYTFPDANATIEYQALRNQNNGYAGLDANARLAAAQMPALTGDVTSSAGTTATTLGSSYKVRPCELTITGSGAGGVLQAADDELAKCRNKFGAVLTIQSVECSVDAGTTTLMLSLRAANGTAGNDVLTGELICGSGSGGYLAGALGASTTQVTDGTLDFKVVATDGAAHEITIVVGRSL